MDKDCVATLFPFELAYSLHKRSAFDVAYGAPYLGDDKVAAALLGKQFDVALDFVGDVRHYLYGLAKIVTLALAFDDGLEDTSRGKRIGPCGPDPGKPLIMTEIEVSFSAIDGNVALAVLVRVERARIDVDVRVELLYGHAVAPCLKELAN